MGETGGNSPLSVNKSYNSPGKIESDKNKKH